MRLFVACLAVLLCGCTASPDPPVFPDQYTSVGVILLPYAELREPFTAYYDGQLGRSRIDYYDDLMLTLQKSPAASQNGLDYGAEYKIAYDVNEKGKAQRVCFQSNGTSDDLIAPQSILPDLTNFTLIGKEPCPQVSFEQVSWKTRSGRPIPDEFKSRRPVSGGHAHHCEKWQLKVTVQDKESTYTFWSRRDGKTKKIIPVHYEMMGVNTLLGSHYDQYEIAYFTFRPGNISDDIFNIDENYDCGGFPGPGRERARLTMNPIGHYLTNPEAEISAHFEDFKDKHGKKYQTSVEHTHRSIVFQNNLRFIESKNRQQKYYRLAVNHLADRTKDELTVLRGRLQSKVKYNGGLPFSSNIKSGDLPAYWDWRLAGAVTPVRDQAICGSCWSFGTVGTITGVNFVKTGKLIQFSEQQLIDCSWNEGNNGCDGGEDFRVYQYVMKVGGLSSDDDYGHYLGVDGKCHDDQVPYTVKLDGFVNVTQYDVDALKKALVENGPVTVAINAAVPSFYFYSNGVYNDPACYGDEDHLDHQVLLVGYGTLYGNDFWLIKNSWSTYWGNDGYVLISTVGNICGVTTSPTYPLIKA